MWTLLRVAKYVSFTTALICLLPIVLALAAEWMAHAYGCQIDFSKTFPCAIWGANRGDTLHTLYILVWVNLATTPIALFAGGLWLALEVVLRAARLKSK